MRIKSASAFPRNSIDPQQKMGTKAIRTLIGESNFEAIRNKGAYYVDKTGFIREILDDGASATLITRPRRFGKSLMMSTLQSFSQIDPDNPGSTTKQEALFKGLTVLEDRDFCRENMGQWPVISISFREVDGNSFEQALNILALQVSSAASQLDFLEDSQKLRPAMRERIGQLCDLPLMVGKISLNELMFVITASLSTLAAALYQHFGRPVLLLIDEYDVPLEKARHSGFYNDMLKVIRPMLGTVMKDAKVLGKAVLTGCLRITHESLFTGLNNFVCHSISDTALSKAFGFTEAETQRILQDFGLSKYAAEVRAHYDGYQFGNTEIYSPWDVLRFCRTADHDQTPDFQSFWLNSSSNDLIYDFIGHANSSLFEIFARLSKGETIAAQIDEAVSYPEIDAEYSPELLLSILYMTGYLTRAGTTAEGLTLLRIPNKAVWQCFEKGIERRFSASNSDFSAKALALAKTLVEGDPREVHQPIDTVLSDYASVRDSAAEGFYHGLLTGLLSCAVSPDGDGYYSNLASNRETGHGYADLTFRCAAKSTGVVLEFKKSRTGNRDTMLASCREALAQIKAKHYCDDLRRLGISKARIYGMAFHAKTFEILSEDIQL